MLVPLTMRLITIPEYGWPRLSAACDRDEPLPTPLMHAVYLACVAVIATFAGSLLNPAYSVMDIVVSTLAAALGYLGAGVAAVLIAAPRIQTSARLQQYVPRFASAACLPVLASGVVNVVPFHLLGVLAAVAGVMTTYWSALIGARDLLGLEGQPRQRAAQLIALVGGAPVLCCAVILWLL